MISNPSKPKSQRKQKRSKASMPITGRVTRLEFSEMTRATLFLLDHGFSLDDLAQDCGMSGGWWSHVKAGHYDRIKPTYLQYKLIKSVSAAVRRVGSRSTRLLELQRDFAGKLSAALGAGVDLLEYSTRKVRV